MVTFFSYCILTGLAALLAVPAAVLFVEVLVATVFPPRRFEAQGEPSRERIAVLIPAHNEGNGIVPTLADIKNQLQPGDRMLVVVDNCTDDTEEVATSAGAEITVRSDLTRIGKGYALDWGIDRLSDDPPAIVIVIDADCRFVPGTLDRLAITCAQSQRPVQSLYLMTAPTGPTINHQVAEFAWRVKNWVRPLGLHALGLPCQLMGTGMAFPWDVIRSADLSSGFIVEDLKLGLELAAAGHAPVFCPSAICNQYLSELGSGCQNTTTPLGTGPYRIDPHQISHLVVFGNTTSQQRSAHPYSGSNRSSNHAVGVIVNSDGCGSGSCRAGECPTISAMDQPDQPVVDGRGQLFGLGEIRTRYSAAEVICVDWPIWSWKTQSLPRGTVWAPDVAVDQN